MDPASGQNQISRRTAFGESAVHDAGHLPLLQDSTRTEPLESCGSFDDGDERLVERGANIELRAQCGDRRPGRRNFDPERCLSRDDRRPDLSSVQREFSVIVDNALPWPMIANI